LPVSRLWMISYSGGYGGERHYRTHLILASLRVVDDLIFGRVRG
jgi:hypothetical protein